MRPQTLLPILIGGALGAAGLLQGLQWRRAAAAAGGEQLESRVRELEREVDLLERENQSLRSLAQGGGEVHVDPALIGFVEEALGLDFRSNPVVHRIAPEELRDRVTASIESRFPPNSLDHRQQAWVLMGLLAPDDRFAAQLAATRSLGARSWFDDQTGEAWVTDRFDERSVPDQAALVRALARVLLHQHEPPPPGYPGDEADRSREALHHGAALAVDNRYLARQAIASGFAGSQVQSDAADLLDSLPVAIRGLATFPSRLGAPRAERLLEAGELRDALHDPPRRTAWFYPEPALPARDPELPATPGTAVLEESAGMLGLQLWLQTVDPELAPLAGAWRGDRYRLSAADDTALSLVWDLRLADADQADAIAPQALAIAGLLAGSAEDPPVGETIEAPGGRRITVLRPEPDLLRFLNQAAP